VLTNRCPADDGCGNPYCMLTTVTDTNGQSPSFAPDCGQPAVGCAALFEHLLT
jgi:hypothetical protein